MILRALIIGALAGTLCGPALAQQAQPAAGNADNGKTLCVTSGSSVDVLLKAPDNTTRWSKVDSDSDALVIQAPPSGLVCKPIDLDLAIRPSGVGGGATPCIVDSIVKLTPAQVDAQPKDQRP